jgi:hypothetical protein
MLRVWSRSCGICQSNCQSIGGILEGSHARRLIWMIWANVPVPDPCEWSGAEPNPLLYIEHPMLYLSDLKWIKIVWIRSAIRIRNNNRSFLFWIWVWTGSASYGSNSEQAGEAHVGGCFRLWQKIWFVDKTTPDPEHKSGSGIVSGSGLNGLESDQYGMPE